MAIMIVGLIALTCSTLVGLSQDGPKPVRLRLSRGRNTAVARGFVGGEATDYFLIRVRAGQQLIVYAISRRRRAQISVAPLDGDSFLSGSQRESDLTRWVGRVPRTGEYLIYVNVHPCAERYTLKVTVR